MTIKLNKIGELKIMKINLLKKNWMSTLIISSLILKYIILFIMSKYFNLKEAEIEIRVVIAILLPIIDLLILWKERVYIWNKGISLLKYICNYSFWMFFIIDCSVAIRASLNGECAYKFLELGIIFWMTYITLDVMVFPVKVNKWKEGEIFTYKEQCKIIFYYVISLTILYRVLSFSDEIITLFVSGIIVLFFKWFYSEDYVYYILKPEKEFDSTMIAEDIKTSYKKKSGHLTIIVVIINMILFTKKIFINKFNDITDVLYKWLSQDLNYNVILTTVVALIVVSIAIVAALLIVNDKIPISVVKQQHDIADRMPLKNKRQKLKRLKKYKK